MTSICLICLISSLEKAPPVLRKGFGETMSFSGWAPEVINGRAAQVAFVAGVGAELATGETLPTQFHDHIFSLVFASVLVALASFMPGIQATECVQHQQPTPQRVQLKSCCLRLFSTFKPQKLLFVFNY